MVLPLSTATCVEHNLQNLAASTAVAEQVITKGVTPLSLGEGTVFKPNGEYVFRVNCHFLSASSRPILFRAMSHVVWLFGWLVGFEVRVRVRVHGLERVWVPVSGSP